MFIGSGWRCSKQVHPTNPQIPPIFSTSTRVGGRWPFRLWGRRGNASGESSEGVSPTAAISFPLASSIIVYCSRKLSYKLEISHTIECILASPVYSHLTLIARPVLLGASLPLGLVGQRLPHGDGGVVHVDDGHARLLHRLHVRHQPQHERGLRLAGRVR